jgi:hypothetical protein
MATETENLVLHILQDVQRTLANHTREFERLRNGQNEIRESIVTALGLSETRVDRLETEEA